MDKSLRLELQRGLTAAMHRFHASFLGEGVHLGEEKIRFRERPDFPAPLVTVLGHTYGLRLEAGPSVEASVNVYDDEFELHRFKSDLGELYEWSHVRRIISNFATPEDEKAVGGDYERLASMFRLDVERDVEVVEKGKDVASVVTGRLVDRVLQVRYAIDERLLEPSSDRALFVTGVYLYCLRPFAAAYRKSLSTSSSGS